MFHSDYLHMQITANITSHGYRYPSCAISLPRWLTGADRYRVKAISTRGFADFVPVKKPLKIEELAEAAVKILRIWDFFGKISRIWKIEKN